MLLSQGFDLLVIADNGIANRAHHPHQGQHRFRCVIEMAGLHVGMSGALQRPGMLLICPVDPHKCCKISFLFLVRVYHLLKRSYCANWIAGRLCSTKGIYKSLSVTDHPTSEDSLWNK